LSCNPVASKIGLLRSGARDHLSPRPTSSRFGMPFSLFPVRLEGCGSTAQHIRAGGAAAVLGPVINLGVMRLRAAAGWAGGAARRAICAPGNIFICGRSRREFLLLVSLLLTTVLSASGKYLVPHLPEAALQILGSIASFGVITLLFATMFKWLPDTSVRWRDVWLGAAITAALFEIGKLLIGLYIGKQALESTYGAASSGTKFRQLCGSIACDEFSPTWDAARPRC